MAQDKPQPADEQQVAAEPEKNTDFDDLPVIDIANEANDDWIKKANPQAALEELRIHEELIAEYRAKAEARAKQSAPK